MKTIHILGSGLVGTLAAIFMAQKGFQVELFEARPDMRKTGTGGGRSINLVVTDRGLRALDKVGLKEKVLDISIPMKGRMLHDVQGQTTFVPYGQKDNEVINAVSRGLLNCLLMDAAEARGNINIHFDKRCTAYDPDTKTITLNGKEKVQADVVIGADGAFSALRKTMLDKVMNFDYSQSFLDAGYKELVIPPGPGGEFLIEKEALHIWPRGAYMMIALPNTDGNFTCTLFFGRDGFDALKTPTDIKTFFEKNFPDALALMPTLIEDFTNNPTGSLVTVKCNPWHIGGQALLIGDAAHAIVPFFGQGMNCGFEDCFVLDELVSGPGADWESVFAKFNMLRKPNADAIADMAAENFIEMRDTTADPKFQLKKKIGFELEKRYPQRFIPRYSMVMFHPEIPYAQAKHLSEIQDGILEKLCANISTPEQTDWVEAERLLKASGF